MTARSENARNYYNVIDLGFGSLSLSGREQRYVNCIYISSILRKDNAATMKNRFNLLE